jgi:hypothetical protein
MKGGVDVMSSWWVKFEGREGMADGSVLGDAHSHGLWTGCVSPYFRWFLLSGDLLGGLQGTKA